ncbi:MAG: hypothetical protein IJL03_02480 [Lachnospiraceae bacterium]|nr:hypothetical protein [Lachnospiraceae bacterium]
MKKAIQRILLLMTAVVLCMSLTGCGEYTSSYSATVLITSNTSKKMSVEFSSLKGKMVHKLKCDGKEGRELKYTASLKSGTATVYYDIDGTREELFTIHGGETADSSLGNLAKGKIYIIIETEGKCEGGSFKLNIE